MENLNAEKVKKALELIQSHGKSTAYNAFTTITNALALIESQEERIEAYRQELAEVRVALAEANHDKKRLTEEAEGIKQCMEHEHASFMETFGEYDEKCDKLTDENDKLHASCTELARVQEENERLERICKSYADDECENLPVLVDGKEVGTWDGIVHIFCCGRAKQIILTANGDESDRFLSLDDCLDEIECDKENEYAIVIIEEGLHGDIYKFGQYSNREWHKCGSTCGFW